MDFCSDIRVTEDQTPQRYLKFAVMMVRMDEHGPEVKNNMFLLFLFVSMYVPKNVGRCSLQRFFQDLKLRICHKELRFSYQAARYVDFF